MHSIIRNMVDRAQYAIDRGLTVGMRRTYDCIPVDTIAPKSYDWDHDNDCASDVELDGACAISIDPDTDDLTHEIIATMRYMGVGKKGRWIGWGGYPGDYISLLVSRDAITGEDYCEIIMIDATCKASIKVR